MDELFYELFEGMTRFGPGSDAATLRALESLSLSDKKLNILDIGCGSGAQSLLLATRLKGTITAIDNYQPFLDLIQDASDSLSLTAQIQYLCEDMKKLNFPEQSIDIAWAEGSIYIMGFLSGLDLIYPMLKKNAYAVFSDMNYLKAGAPASLIEFFEKECPEMISKEQNIQLIKNSRFELVDHFELEKDGHWANYYEPLQQRVLDFSLKYAHNMAALEISASIQEEIDLYKKYADYYGYVFYIMQKKH